jgi:hypothetical protein
VRWRREHPAKRTQRDGALRIQSADELAARRWLKDLQTNRNGEAKGNLANVVHAMEHAPALQGRGGAGNLHPAHDDGEARPVGA